MNMIGPTLELALPVPPVEQPRPVEPIVAFSVADVRALFGRSNAYPVRLPPASVNIAAVQLFAQWSDLARIHYHPAELPWLPVGRTGPLLVLGHYDIARPLPLPRGWVQPVLLQRAEYERHSAAYAPLIEAVGRPDWKHDSLVAPRRMFPGCDPKLIQPTTVRAALRFMIEYFPHTRTDLQRVHELLVDSDEIEFSDLPHGYACACWLVLGRGGVADPTAVAIPDQIVRRIPPDVSARVRIVSECEKNIWVAADHLPQPQLEDMLLNELGDGWYVHLLRCPSWELKDDFSRGEPPRVDPRPNGNGGSNDDRVTIRIENRRASAPGQVAADPGVIRLSRRDIRELEAYDARRPDRDPLKVFFKELSAGIRHGATDLHIEVGLDSYRVRARIDGYLEEWLEMPVGFGRMVIGAAKEQFGMPPERWMPQDGACTVYHGTDIVNLRVAAYPVRGAGQKLAIRYLPRRGDVPSIDHLMGGREAALIRRAITRPYGLILLCGPTGSGKTTTTFAALAEINKPDVNITTMEDPVEYEMDGINQAEIDRARGVDWAALLAAFLRQDPDVGMVGEIRDRATAETAIRLTLTGHIVFATLHTMSCAHTVERLVDTGVNAQMLADSATLIVSQRLVRRLCPRCKQAGQRPTTATESDLFTRHGIVPPGVVFDPAGTECIDCRNTGYRGQVGAFEMLPVTPDVAHIIAEKQSVRAIDDWMKGNGFPRVYDAALALVARGETSFAEANQWQPVWSDMPHSGNSQNRL